MTVFRRHLGYFYAVIILTVCVKNDSGEHVIRGSPNIPKQNRHLLRERGPGTRISKNYNSSKPYLKTTITSGDIRLTSDQYKWPWKTYEEWKRNQERIENEIDQIVKYGGKNVHASNLTKIPNSKHRKFGLNSGKRKKRPNMRRRLKRRRKKKLLEKQNKKIMKKAELEDNFSGGGAVLSVKYYSTEDGPTASFEKFDTLVKSFSSTAKPFVGHSEIFAQKHLHQKTRWAAKNHPGVNECSVDNGGCEGLCVRSKSSYYCHCPEGFRLNTLRRKCIDLNECLSRNGHGPCQGDCLNEWGSFKCGCGSIRGTQLDADGVTCVPIDLCARADCSHICINTRSGAFCSCPEGYILENDWKTCKEVLFNE